MVREKYISLTVKPALLYFRLFVVQFVADKILYYTIRHFYFVAVVLPNTVTVIFFISCPEPIGITCSNLVSTKDTHHSKYSSAQAIKPL